MRARTRGTGRVYQRGGVWWIDYYVDGQKRRESAAQVTGDGSEESARRLLRRRLHEKDEGRLPARSAATTVKELRALLESDYGARGLRSAETALDALDHVAGYFGPDASASAITYDGLLRYVQHRREQERAAAATVRNELVYLRRGMQLARKAKRLGELPEFPRIEVDNARMGFLEDDEVELLLGALRSAAPDVADVAEFLAWTGWRKEEALGLTWREVNVKARTLLLPASRAKGKAARPLPYGELTELVELLQRRRTLVSALELRTGERGIEWVFCWTKGRRTGERISGEGDFYRRWRNALKAAGLPEDRIPHDLRRSMARRGRLLGIPESVLMRIGGWKTRTIFERYSIVADRDVEAALGRFSSRQNGHSEQAQSPQGRR
jgi:integrase